MKCSYCGKELPVGASVCDGCGSRVDNQQMMNNPNNSNNPNLMYQNYGGYHQPKKNNNTMIIIIIVVILVIGGAVGAWFLLKGDDEGKAKDEQEETTEKDDEVAKTFELDGYILTLPKGYVVEENLNSIVSISGGNCSAILSYTPIKIDLILSVESTFIEGFSNDGYVITSHGLKTILGRDVYVLKRTKNGVETAILYIDANEDTSLNFIISTKNGASFNDNWITDAVSIANSAEEK